MFVFLAHAVSDAPACRKSFFFCDGQKKEGILGNLAGNAFSKNESCTQLRSVLHVSRCPFQAVAFVDSRAPSIYRFDIHCRGVSRKLFARPSQFVFCFRFAWLHQLEQRAGAQPKTKTCTCSTQPKQRLNPLHLTVQNQSATVRFCYDLMSQKCDVNRDVTIHG